MGIGINSMSSDWRPFYSIIIEKVRKTLVSYCSIPFVSLRVPVFRREIRHRFGLKGIREPGRRLGSRGPFLLRGLFWLPISREDVWRSAAPILLLLENILLLEESPGTFLSLAVRARRACLESP